MTDIKYSFILPYYDRLNQLAATLVSFMSFYQDRKDIEIIIVGDEKMTSEEESDLFQLLSTCGMEFPYKYIKYIDSEGSTFNPAPKFNEGVKHANGEFLVITNPECAHAVDVLSGFDSVFEVSKDIYVICGCMSLNKDGSDHMWYQHSKHRNKGYHFCSCLSYVNYKKIGGFNEEYKHGWGYDDDSFIARVKHSDLVILLRDDLRVFHLYHEKIKPPKGKEKLQRNKNLFEQELEELRRSRHV